MLWGIVPGEPVAPRARVVTLVGVRRFVSPRWLVKHAVAAVLVTGCLLLGWWQVGRAAGGNALSWAYAVEWPLFALFVVGVWVREIRTDGRPPVSTPPPAGRRRPVVVPVARDTGTAPDDPALASYNEYLAWLAANPDRRPLGD